MGRGYALRPGPPDPPSAALPMVPAGRTGIDYLRLIAERHRLAIQAGFGVTDPSRLLDDPARLAAAVAPPTPSPWRRQP